jgi:hypothetical protein
MKRIIVLLVVGVLSQSCAPERVIPIMKNPEIAQSAVPSVQKVIVVQEKIKEATAAQQIDITAIDGDITKSLEYAVMMKPYTDVDSNGVSLHSGLVRSLNSADTHINLLNLANQVLIAEQLNADKILDQILEYSRQKDAESEQWVKVSINKDQIITELKTKLDQSIETQTTLRLDLEDAMVYKKTVIALVALLFAYFLFKAVASVWLPFGKFRV